MSALPLLACVAFGALTAWALTGARVLARRHRTRAHCPHANVTGIYGDPINHCGGWRLRCDDCGRHLEGPVAMAATRGPDTHPGGSPAPDPEPEPDVCATPGCGHPAADHHDSTGPTVCLRGGRAGGWSCGCLDFTTTPPPRPADRAPIRAWCGEHGKIAGTCCAGWAPLPVPRDPRDGTGGR